MANISIPTIKEMDNLLDEKTYDIYKKGLTCTINQVDSDFATGLVKRYCPKSVSEMSAFVAIIRPGCASLLQDFVDRKSYTTGVTELDNLLSEGNHRMIYQELIMKYLIWLGIPETNSYDIIKKIAKKKFKEAELNDLKQKLLVGWKNRVGKEEGFTETWTVVEQAAKYSFNASHSLSYAYDSLYGAYLKSHYPMEYYTVALNYYADDIDKTTKLAQELSSFGIELKAIKFRYSKSNYTPSFEDKKIYKGIQSVKYMNSSVADELYELRNNKYDSFVNLLYDLENLTSIKSNQLAILIKLDFFDEFGESNHLLHIVDMYDIFENKSQIKKSKLDELNIDYNIVRPYAKKETEKTFLNIQDKMILNNIFSVQKGNIPRMNLKDKIQAQKDYLGHIEIKDSRYAKMAVVIDVNTRYSPKLKMYSLKNGTTLDCKIEKKIFNKNKIQDGDIVAISQTKTKPKVHKNENGEWEIIEGENEIWITKYKIVNDL